MVGPFFKKLTFLIFFKVVNYKKYHLIIYAFLVCIVMEYEEISQP